MFTYCFRILADQIVKLMKYAPNKPHVMPMTIAAGMSRMTLPPDSETTPNLIAPESVKFKGAPIYIAWNKARVKQAIEVVKKTRQSS